VQWALDTAGLVIEDDCDAEFRLRPRTSGTVQALAPEHLVYARFHLAGERTADRHQGLRHRPWFRHPARRHCRATAPCAGVGLLFGQWNLAHAPRV